MRSDKDGCKPSPLAGEGGARAKGVGGRGGVPSKSDLLARAKWMRANPTEAERKIWAILRGKRLTGFKFRRQVIIDWYIVDFINFDHRLIIEADGSQHAESEYDERRDAFLKRQGFTVLRFWNNEILNNSDGVTEAIWHELQTPPLPSAALRLRSGRLPPSPVRGEGLESVSNVSF